VKNTDDGFLAEFPSVVDAVRCAVEVQRGMADREPEVREERRIRFRIGVNLGDVIVEEHDIFGDGVNVAARLEGLAEPGGICASRAVRDQARDRLDYTFEDLGERQVKNIARPLRVYRIGDPAIPLNYTMAATSEPSQLPEKPAIAVLPFVNMSGDTEQEFFADGITEDIITLLAGWRSFPIIARTSTFTYKGRNIDLKKVGEELGAQYIVEGSVRKSGRRVRVTAQLIGADTGYHIMAEKCDRDLSELFDLQDEIVAAIAGAIEPELLKFERERIAGRPQVSGSAYELYQRGMWHHYRQNEPDNIQAQAYFRRALAIEPQYLHAAAALSVAVSSAAMVGWADNPDARFEEAYVLAQEAISLDPRYPNAHFALGLACMWTRRSERGIKAFEEAIKFNPSFAAAQVLLGQMYLYDGRPEEALEQVEKGIRLSPTDQRLSLWLVGLAGAHYQMRRYEQAVEAGKRSWSLNRNWPHGLRYVVAGLAQLGRIEEAQTALSALQSLDANLEIAAAVLHRNWPPGAAVDHILEGLRKAGMPED
jgi:adenylate cyclase